MFLKFGYRIYHEGENGGAGIGAASADSVDDSGPTLAQALAADRGIVTTSVASPPAATTPSSDPVPVPAQPTSESASPPAPAANGQTQDPDVPPVPPGVASQGVTPNSEALRAQQTQVAAQQAQYIQNVQLQNTYNEALRLGATPEQAKAAIQLLTTQQTIRNQQEALENHPVTREIAAKQIAGTYAKWGVKPEDIISAPNPQAMQYAAYTLANANRAASNQTKTANLQTRAANGNDSFESGSTNGRGETIDYNKSSGFSLMRRALSMSK